MDRAGPPARRGQHREHRRHSAQQRHRPHGRMARRGARRRADHVVEGDGPAGRPRRRIVGARRRTIRGSGRGHARRRRRQERGGLDVRGRKRGPGRNDRREGPRGHRRVQGRERRGRPFQGRGDGALHWGGRGGLLRRGEEPKPRLRRAGRGICSRGPGAAGPQGGGAVRPKPQGQESRGQRSRLAAEIHARHLEEARKKAVSRSAAASRAKQAAYQSAKSRNIAANVAAKEGRGASR